MKQASVLFTLAICLIFSFKGIAQCIPDTSITRNIPGIYPDSATGLPHAFVGVPYSTVLQVKVPRDTVYQGLPAVIDSIKVTGVSGIPSGFSYQCNPNSCVFPGGSDACVLIQGNAPTVGQVGIYPIVVDMTIYGRVLGFPQTIQDSNDNYRIVIENPTSVAAQQALTFGVKQNAPNPFSRFTSFTVTSPSNANITLKVTDLIGNVIHTSTRSVSKGNYNWTFDAAELENGVYLYIVSDGRNSVTRRFVVSRR
ncbi:MAG: T9SS C-terminal target domain-containing protein [Bacteroidetes bacterium]|nr:MAG: T9SS C-terminal target domain-containing protein [Bacteroidota bacterium]REK06948.1 MAG: T9SS C-terminal target domain-containing protein [Bacteroidota bacterium]REK33704.1 MAG: T9SS C-terminal target domain-containing protein [Bacteroidota bacterium]REK47219.1 MAG: T9SS C-terminal target domain-containing protein [Bacteroidota bacterium]